MVMLRRYCIRLLLPALFFIGTGIGFTQDFRVGWNKMQVILPEKIKESALDSFLHRYNLEGIGIKEYLINDNKKILFQNGWAIEKLKGDLIQISKPLETSVDLQLPLNKAVFREVPTSPDWQQREGDKAIFGVNLFKDGEGFRVKDSVVSFHLEGYTDAKSVRLAGSFTDWQHAAFPMTKTDEGWDVRVTLAPGRYYYKFIVNEDGWMTDPANLLKENDGQGNTNSVFFVTNHLFRLEGHINAEKVVLSGSFNGWDEEETPLQKGKDGWQLRAFLGDGTYAYHYKIDGNDYTDTIITASGPIHHFFAEGFNNAKMVSITGDFNDWQKGGSVMKKTAGGWVLDYQLGPGNYRYHINVDGVARADSFLVIGANYTFHLKGFDDAKKVQLAGDFNNWNPDGLPMQHRGNEWVCSVYLPKGKHLYKFIIDGKWVRDPASNTWEDNDYGTGNSVLWVRGWELPE